MHCFGQISPLWMVSTEPTTFRHESNRSDLTLSPVGSRFELLPPNSVGLAVGWAQTQPGPTHGHP